MTFRLRARRQEPPRPRTAHEARGEYVVQRKGETNRIVERTVRDLPDDAYLLVREPRRDGTIRLLHLYRARVAHEILTEVVDVEKSLLPAGTATGNVVQWRGGAFVAHDSRCREKEVRDADPAAP